MRDLDIQEILADEIKERRDYSDEVLVDWNRQAIKEAEEHGLIVYEPRDYELQLDIDTAESTVMFFDRLGSLKRSFPKARYLVTNSKGGNHHIRVVLGDDIKLDPRERIALQVMMGSDHRRELFALRRIFLGVPAPTVLFETKEAAQTINDWFKELEL